MVVVEFVEELVGVLIDLIRKLLGSCLKEFIKRLVLGRFCEGIWGFFGIYFVEVSWVVYRIYLEVEMLLILFLES